MKKKTMLLIFAISVLLLSLIIYLSVDDLRQVNKSQRTRSTTKQVSTINIPSVPPKEDNEVSYKLLFTLPWDDFVYNQNAHAIYYTGTNQISQVNINGIVPIFTVFQKGYPVFFLNKVENDTLIRVTFKGHEVVMPFWTIRQDHQSIFQFFINQEGFYIRKDFSYICTNELQESVEGQCNEGSYYLEI